MNPEIRVRTVTSRNVAKDHDPRHYFFSTLTL